MTASQGTAKLGSAPGLDVGRCLDEAIEVYKRNVLTLVFAAITWQFLSGLSLMILAGPLTGGAAVLSLRALRRPDRKVEFRDLFAGFGRFWALTGLFVLNALAMLIAFGMFIVPGLVLMTLWLYPILFLVDRNLGTVDSLRASQEAVVRRGFWPHALLMLIVLVLTVLPIVTPFGGPIASWLLTPLAWLTLAAAYCQAGDPKPSPLRSLDDF